MRVAVISPWVRGAFDHYVPLLAQALGAHVDLRLFVPEHFAHDPAGVTVERFRTGRTRAAAAAAYADPRGGRRLWQRVLAARPEAVHLFTGDVNPWARPWARWSAAAGIPFGLTVHDVEPHPGDTLERALVRLRAPLLDHVAGIHVHSRDALSELRRLTATPAAVIPHGDCSPAFAAHAGAGAPPPAGARSALFFGRLAHYKGIDVLAAAADLLPPDYRVTIAGPGRLEPAVRERVRARPERFTLLARYLDDATAAGLIRSASVLVLPYRQVTQSSLPLIAAGLGVPVVASALGAFREDVPAVGGVLVAPGDPRALADGIIAATGRTPIRPAALAFEALAPRFADWYTELARRGAR